MMSIQEEDRQDVLEYVEAINRLNLDKLRELITPDALI
jgi:hypothetical protein